MQTGAATALPQILAQPQNRIVGPDEAATFTVVAADTRLLAYQWRFNGTDITSATNDAVVLQNVSTNNEGEYRVVLTNPSGSVTSSPAMLWFDGDGDGMADSFELAQFGNLNQLPNGDLDGDGSSNLQEFLDGTNPANTNSVRFHLTVVRDGGVVVVSPELSNYTNGQNVTLTALASPGGEPFHAWLGDIASRDNPVTLVMTNNKTVFARFAPVLFTWTNALSGDWNIATNWHPNLVPGSNDSVVIAVATGPTVTLNTSADCNEFVLGNETLPSTLTGSGALAVHGNFSWFQGTMSGNGRTIIAAGATLNIPNPSGVFLNLRALENGGTILWTGAGSFVLNSGAVLTNRPGALLDVQNAAPIQANVGSGRIDNAGIFRKSVNAGTTPIGSGISFNNSGAVQIQSGTLQFNGSFTNNSVVILSAGTTNRLTAGGSGGGTFNAAGAALVEWTAGTFTLNPGAQLNGAGVYRINSGTLTPTANIAVENLDLINGTLDGTSTVTVNTAMNWTGGTMSGSGRTIIAAGATLNIPNPSGVFLNLRTLDNGGTIFWTGAGSFVLNSGAVVTNRAGALFHVQNAASLQASVGVGRIDNAGTFRKSANTGTTTVASGVSFTNSGTVDIRSGILAASGGYISTSTALLNCALGGTTAGTGYGQLQIAGTVTLNGGLSVDLLPGFSPTTNDTFTVLTAGTRNGTNTSFTYPANRVTMQLSNTATSVIIRATDIFSVPQPVLFTPQLVGSNALLTWTATSNVAYRLEFNPDLNPSNWNVLPGDVTTLSNTASKLDALTSSNRLYRVRVLP